MQKEQIKKLKHDPALDEALPRAQFDAAIAEAAEAFADERRQLKAENQRLLNAADMAEQRVTFLEKLR